MQTRNRLQLLKTISKLRILIFLGLLIIGPNIQADTTETTPSDTIEEEHDTKNLDKLLINYNKDQEKVLKDAEAIGEDQDTGDEISEKELATTSSNFKKLDPKNLKKISYSDSIKITLEPLQKMSESQLVALLHENTKDSKAGIYIDRFPKLAIFTVRLIKDPKALPSLAKIIDDQDRLIHFSSAMIVTILISLILKRFMKKEGRTILRAFGLWFLRFSIISFLRFGVLYYFFSAELTPMFNIGAKTFF
jgi:hypothetical protein